MTEGPFSFHHRLALTAKIIGEETSMLLLPSNRSSVKIITGPWESAVVTINNGPKSFQLLF